MQGMWKRMIGNIRLYGLTFCRWLLLGVVMGGVGGGLGALFARTITAVTHLRAQHSWLLFLLPIGGLLSVAVYRLLRVKGLGTNQVFESVRAGQPVSFWLAPAVFAATVLTHLGGGSAGREGAALQLGGGVATLMGRLLRLDEKARHILTLCGMAAFFSALFGTPLGAGVFALEVVSVGSVCLAAIFPVFISAMTAFFVSSAFGVPPERFELSAVPEATFGTLWRVLVIAIIGALVSVLFCCLLHRAEHVLTHWIKNEYLRILLGGAAVILLTLILGTTDYNGGGIEVIHRIFAEGEVRYEAFLLKIFFTVITVAAGYKGGEIVPTFFIGATLGGSLALLLGLDPALGAAVGMAALFCGVTNCPLASLFLAVELFGAAGLLYCALAVVTAFLLSGNTGLYAAQRLLFSKLTDERLAE